MKIGVDLRALQIGHKYRGIGEVAKQVTDRVMQLAYENGDNTGFVFYEYDDGEEDPKKLLTIPSGLNYETVKLGPIPEKNLSATKKDKLRRNFSALYGNPVKEAANSDVFLQFDYNLGIPKNTRTVLIKHDLIPYIFWDKYFESAWVPFKNKAARTTLRTLFANHKYLRVLRRSLRNADVILTVSESTKNDVENYFHINPKKVRVARLGVTVKESKTHAADTNGVQLPAKPYLLFVGAGDARRRVEDAVAMYNNLKAEGNDIQLVLVGENFQDPKKIPNQVVRDAVMGSSYGGDILTLGYVNDATKQSLYKGAIAFVYPTRYEGFGIPILEAMLLECPIISYRNSSTEEVGGEYAYYANNWYEMKKQVEEIMSLTDAEGRDRKVAAKSYAEQFTWDKTARIVYDELISRS